MKRPALTRLLSQASKVANDLSKSFDVLGRSVELAQLQAQDKKQSPFVEAFFWGTMYIIFILLTAILAR